MKGSIYSLSPLFSKQHCLLGTSIILADHKEYIFYSITSLLKTCHYFFPQNLQKLVLLSFDFLLLVSLICNIASFSSNFLFLALYHCCQSSISACKFFYRPKPLSTTQTFSFSFFKQALLMMWHSENLLTVLSGGPLSYVS